MQELQDILILKGITVSHRPVEICRMSTIWDAANSVTIVLIHLIYNTQFFYLHVDMSDTLEYCRFKPFNNNKMQGMQGYHIY